MSPIWADFAALRLAGFLWVRKTTNQKVWILSLMRRYCIDKFEVTTRLCSARISLAAEFDGELLTHRASHCGCTWSSPPCDLTSVRYSTPGAFQRTTAPPVC